MIKNYTHDWLLLVAAYHASPQPLSVCARLGRTTVAARTSPQMSMSLKDVQQKFVTKCESKCQGGATVARQLRKMFQQVDLDNDGLVNIREWATVVEATNGAISTDEACALFEFWDTAGYARDPSGAVSISEAIASLMSSEVQSVAVFDDCGHGAPPPSRGGDSERNTSNMSSAPGGIFGGGVYESDSRIDHQRALASRAAATKGQLAGCVPSSRCALRGCHESINISRCLGMVAVVVACDLR